MPIATRNTGSGILAFTGGMAVGLAVLTVGRINESVEDKKAEW